MATIPKFQTMQEIMDELKPSNEIMRTWLRRHRSCFTGKDHNALESAALHTPDCYTKEHIINLMGAEQRKTGVWFQHDDTELWSQEQPLPENMKTISINGVEVTPQFMEVCRHVQDYSEVEVHVLPHEPDQSRDPRRRVALSSTDGRGRWEKGVITGINIVVEWKDESGHFTLVHPSAVHTGKPTHGPCKCKITPEA